MTNPAVSYVVRTIPRLSETFVLRELVALHQAGFPIEVWALVPAEADQIELVPEFAEIAPLVREVPGGRAGLLSMVGDLAKVIARHPLRGLHALWWSARWAIHDRDPRQLAALPYAAHLALHARGRHFHAHFANTPATTALLAGMLSAPPRSVSFTGHARDLWTATSDRFLRDKIARARFVVAGTTITERFLEQAGPLGKEIVVARHGVEFDGRANASREHVEPGLVVGVGRLVEKKGFEDLLRAVAGVAGHGAAGGGEGVAHGGTAAAALVSGVRLALVGDGPLREHLAAEAAALGIADRVEFLGGRSQAQITELLDRAAVFSLPCIVDSAGDSDTFPLAIVEALRQGVPVLTTTVGEMGLVLTDGDNARLVEPGSPEALTAALSELLTDPATAERIGAAGRALAQRDYDTAVAVQPLIAALTAATGA